MNVSLVFIYNLVSKHRTLVAHSDYTHALKLFPSIILHILFIDLFNHSIYIYTLDTKIEY